MTICRSCDSQNLESFIDLGFSPISNAFLVEDELKLSETYYPLHVFTCIKCGFTQLPEVSSRETHFASDYVYFSSFSSSWLEHCFKYSEKMIGELSLDSQDLVVEIASNDGYLLQYFKNKGVQVQGVEPSSNVADVAISERGIPTTVDFFGLEVAMKLKRRGLVPKLMIANNVLAHVPDINDFISGFKTLLHLDGVATFEFPHLLNLIQSTQFDTVYHEHYSYLNLIALDPLFKRHGLRIVNVEKLPTHGGSLRIHVRHSQMDSAVSPLVEEIIKEELELDPRNETIRIEFRRKVNEIKLELWKEIVEAKQAGKTIAAYGAAAKGNTLLNFCGLKNIEIDYVVDQNTFKQGKYLPGSHIPVVGFEFFASNPPDIILILPWNLSEEISDLLDSNHIPARRLVAVPQVRYL